MSSDHAVKVRRARRDRVCSCGRVISAGERYTVWTDFRASDAGWAHSAGHPVQMPACRECHPRTADLIAAEEGGE